MNKIEIHIIIDRFEISEYYNFKSIIYVNEETYSLFGNSIKQNLITAGLVGILSGFLYLENVLKLNLEEYSIHVYSIKELNENSINAFKDLNYYFNKYNVELSCIY